MAAINAFPLVCEIIMAGIVIELLVPPILIVSGKFTLFTTITAVAPAFCAFIAFTTKSQVPLLTTAIFPLISLVLIKVLHPRSEEHTSELQSRPHLVCRLLLEKKNNKKNHHSNTYIYSYHYY